MTLAAAQAGATDSSNFPLTVSLDGNVQAADVDLKTVGNGGYVQNANGYDIRPYSDSALTTALTYELVFYEATTGKLEMHVKVPTVSHTSDTVIYLAFGDATINTDGSSNTTWDSNYQGVWHLPNGTTLTALDSTSNAINGTISGPTVTAGQIDGGANYAAGGDDISFTNPSLGTGAYTMSLWAYTAVTSGNQTAFSLSTGYYEIWAGDYCSGTYRWTAYSNTGATCINSGVNATQNTWFYLTLTRDGSGNVKYYVDSIQKATTTNSESIGSGTSRIGARFSDSLAWNGKLDEVRLSNIDRSADWIITEYNAQKVSSTFIAWGARTAVSGAAAATSDTMPLMGL